MLKRIVLLSLIISQSLKGYTQGGALIVFREFSYVGELFTVARSTAELSTLTRSLPQIKNTATGINSLNAVSKHLNFPHNELGNNNSYNVNNNSYSNQHKAQISKGITDAVTAAAKAENIVKIKNDFRLSILASTEQLNIHHENGQIYFTHFDYIKKYVLEEVQSVDEMIFSMYKNHLKYLKDRTISQLKLLGEQGNDIFVEYQKKLKEKNLKQRVLSNCRVIIDYDVLKHKNISDLPLASKTKFEVKMSNGNYKEGFRVGEKNAAYFLNYSDRVIIRMDNEDVPQIIDQLRQPAIKYSDIKILSLLYKNLETDAYLEKQFKGKLLKHDFSNLEEIENLLKENKGSPIILLAHTEDANYVVRDLKNQIMLKIPFEKILEWREQYDLRLLVLACKSGLINRTSGPIQEIFSVENLKRIKTTQKCKTHEQFLDSLATNNSMFVIESSFFKFSTNKPKKIITARIFEKKVKWFFSGILALIGF